MGNDSEKSITDSAPQGEPERSGLCSDRDHPEQGSLASGKASGEEGQGVDSQYETIETYHKGWQRGYRLGYKQMKDHYLAKIVVLEKQVAHWREIARR